MLKTVHVPPELEPIFAAAEATVSSFFRSRKDDPEHGTIEIFGERYILVRAASLSVEFFELVEQLFGEGREAEADQFARNILFDLAHALGRSDARNFHRKMNLVDPIAKLSAGPVHFSHTGWAYVDIFAESRPVPNDDYYLIFDHPYSFESDAWLRAGKRREFPVCIMNAGWSSGWCEESFGVQLVSAEILCRAKGDPTCRFIMAPPGRIEGHVGSYVAKGPESAQAKGRYEIPDFFSRKRADEELRRLYERLKELDTLKTQFFANVSHELRTPLALILGPVEKWLGSTAVPPELRSDLGLIGRNARSLLKHVNDILDISKLEAGKMAAEYCETDLARLVRATAGNFDGLAQERRIDFSVIAPERLRAQVDPDKLERVLLNLLSNAFKYTPAGGKVRLGVGASDAQVKIVVADSGPGVPESSREAIFERFHQGERGSTRRFGGTGLGLAIARDFVTLHGGTIAVGTAPEGGASFTVTVPLEAAPGTRVRPDRPRTTAGMQIPEIEELSSREPVAPSPPRGTRGKVLVVEDNAELASFLVKELSRDFDCERAADGAEGLAKASELEPDLILSDVMMPNMSGDRMVREIRRTERLAAIPVVMLTAKADDELRVAMLREGVQDYLVKPFSIEELRARVGNLVMAKRTRDVLQRELGTRKGDLESLATEIATRRRELQDALDDARIAKDHAEQASRVKSDFLSMVSHELRTPLSTLVFQLDVLDKKRAGEVSPANEKALRRMVAAAGRLSQMVTSILEYARLEHGRIDVESGPVDLGDLAREVVEELEPQASQRSIDLKLGGSARGPVVQSDARLLRLALTNLVANAVKFTEEGEVVVTVERSGDSSRLAVRDTGHGIPREKQAVIFEPFEQLEPLYSKTVPGVGLGLSIVRELMQALGGHVEVVSTVGAGSTFTIVLPGRGAAGS